MGGGRATLRDLSHTPRSQSPMKGLSHPPGPKPPTPSVPSPLAMGCLAGDPDPDRTRKKELELKTGEKRGRNREGRRRPPKGGGGEICVMGPSKALFLTKVLIWIIVLNLCRSTLALEELRN